MSTNPYYSPADCGLEKVGELDEANLSWEYNTLMVVKCKASGRVFYAADSGCSCPTPFEDYLFDGPDETNLTEIRPGDSFTSFEREVEAFPVDQQKRGELIDAVRRLLK